MPSSGPKPTDLTKKKSPAKKPEEKAQPEVVNGDAAAPVENGKSFMKSKTYDQQFFVQIARFDFQEKK